MSDVDRDIKLKIRIERTRRQLERLEREGRGDSLPARALRDQLHLDRKAVGWDQTDPRSEGADPS